MKMIKTKTKTKTKTKPNKYLFLNILLKEGEYELVNSEGVYTTPCGECDYCEANHEFGDIECPHDGKFIPNITYGKYKLIPRKLNPETTNYRFEEQAYILSISDGTWIKKKVEITFDEYEQSKSYGNDEIIVYEIMEVK